MPTLEDIFTETLFDYHGIVAHLRDGRVIAWSRYSRYADFGADGEHDEWLQRVPDLKYIERVIEVQFDYGIPLGTKTQTIDGLSCKMNLHEAVGKSLYGNVVGMTLLGTAENVSGGTLTRKAFGTTVQVDIIAVGPP